MDLSQHGLHWLLLKFSARLLIMEHVQKGRRLGGRSCSPRKFDLHRVLEAVCREDDDDHAHVARQLRVKRLHRHEVAMHTACVASLSANCASAHARQRRVAPRWLGAAKHASFNIRLNALDDSVISTDLCAS